MTAKVFLIASAFFISGTYLLGYYSQQIGKNLAKYKSDIIKEELMTKVKSFDYKYS